MLHDTIGHESPSNTALDRLAFGNAYSSIGYNLPISQNNPFHNIQDTQKGIFLGWNLVVVPALGHLLGQGRVHA
jgi:hypothetical protein